MNERAKIWATVVAGVVIGTMVGFGMLLAVPTLMEWLGP